MDWSGYPAGAAYSSLACFFLLPAVDKGKGSKSVDVQRDCVVYDERLQFMSRHDAIRLDDFLDAGEVSRAWLVLSGAAETPLADAYQFCGVPIPTKGLVLGRGSALFRVVRLGGHKVRKARGNSAGALDAADVFLYRDSSIAPLLHMRRKLKAVMGVLEGMVRHGASFSRSVELTAWDGILAVGPLYLVIWSDLHAVEGSGLGDFHRVASDVYHRRSDFIHGIFVRRRNEASKMWRNWFGEDPMVHP